MTLRVAFMGTPDFAVPTLEALVAAGHDVVSVFTRAAARSGRGMRERISPVQAAAERHGCRVLTPASARREPEAFASGLDGTDVAVIVAYGLILPVSVLAMPHLGCLNLHASLLPRWRGAAPIHRAVMAGDRETGLCAMRMEEGLDTGPVGLSERVTIAPDETTGDLHDRLAGLGGALMTRALASLESGTLAFTPQEADGVTYAAKIANEEARIDWAVPATRVHDQIRGLSPWPGAFFEADLGRGPERIKVLRAALGARSGATAAPGSWIGDGLIACGEGTVRPLLLQRAGRGPVGAEEFWRGVREPVSRA